VPIPVSLARVAVSYAFGFRFDFIFPLATAASRHDDRHRREKARQENPALLKRLDQLEAEQVGSKSEITAIPPDAVKRRSFFIY
jgi:hypothetical protein